MLAAGLPADAEVGQRGVTAQSALQYIDLKAALRRPVSQQMMY
jgi:hypothetical protein